jgi:hypothetical protein
MLTIFSIVKSSYIKLMIKLEHISETQCFDHMLMQLIISE